ncbi:MAG: hypothetical protein KUG77_15625, partial [Nannocystaceae bacterium]|nr:hypothetical protein [Nannocystaceae bacterium]
GQVAPPAWIPGVASVQFTVVEFPAAVPLGGLTLEVCDLADIDCTTPADSAMTSAAGEVEVAVSTEASSYFQVTGEGVVDSLFFRRNVPPPSDPYITELGALSPGTLGAFIALTGAQDDAMRGHLIVTARDCDEALAEGVVIEVDTADEAATVAYLDGGLPSTEATQTDESGRAGVLNLPAGPTVVTTRVAQTGAVIGVRTIFVRPDQLSLVGMIPTER